MKSLIETELQRSFPLIIRVFNIIGELLWSSVLSYFALPPDKSGVIHRKSLQDFNFQNKLSAYVLN